MPFGKKKPSESTAEYTLVLNPVRSELSKSRMIERIAQVFPLGVEEAADLVENTPIILLEGLDRETGDQVRLYFTETGADLILTDDKAFQKRCFRAIWPSPPTFDFLQTSSVSERKDVPAEQTASEEEDVAKLFSQASSLSESSSQEDTYLPPGPQTVKEDVSFFQTESAQNEETWDRDQLKNIERETEDALLAKRVTDLTQEKERLQELLLDLQKENEELRHEKTKFASEQTNERENQEIERRHLEARLKSEETSRQEEKETRDAQLSQLNSITENQKLELSRLEKKLWETTTSLESRQTEIEQLRGELQAGRSEMDVIKQSLRAAEQRIASQAAIDGNRVKELEQKIHEKEAELTTWRQKTENWSKAHASLNQDLQMLRQKYIGEIEQLTSRQKELQMQLEVAQRQIREFNSIAEQQEMVNRKNQIAAQLIQKENRLKELKQQEEMIKHEVTERQEIMQTSREEQQTLEEEIIKDRQAQKFLLEQLKLKDKSRTAPGERFQVKK